MEIPTNNNINLKNIIAECFYQIHWDIQLGLHTYYDLIGGRGSGKSSFIGQEIVLGILLDPNANAIIYRKIGDTLRTSVFEQILWAIDSFDLNDYWYCTVSPMQCMYIPTGQKILFKGLDKAKKSKSIKVSKGYFKYLYFEEMDEYAGNEEIRNVQQSVLRGGTNFVVFKAMNPPKSLNNWANLAIAEDENNPDCLVFKNTYLDIPQEFLGQQFINDAEWLKQRNFKAYQHEYLGIPVGLGSEVFDNLEKLKMSDEQIAEFDRIYMGIDWGWYPDPFQWVKCYYTPSTHDLYIFDELRAWKTRNIDLWKRLQTEKGVTNYDLIIADNSNNDIADFHAYGCRIRAVKKWQGSVKYRIKWMQGLNHIYIDPIRCPYAWKEFLNYTYILDPNGNPTSELPDADNHAIDSTCYSLQNVWMKKGQ